MLRGVLYILIQHSLVPFWNFESVLMKWMNLEPEVSQSEREEWISYINAYIWNLERWYWWTYLQGSNGDADTENSYGLSIRRRGWDELREDHGNIYITMCEIDSQWEFALWCRKLKPSALWQPRGVGWGGRWEGGSRGRRHMYTCGWFMLMYGRNQHNIVKQLSSNKKNFFKERNHDTIKGF